MFTTGTWNNLRSTWDMSFAANTYFQHPGERFILTKLLESPHLDLTSKKGNFKFLCKNKIAQIFTVFRKWSIWDPYSAPFAIHLK